MSPELQKIENEALLLPPEDKEILIQTLQQSLESQKANAIDQAWIQEAERRYKDYKNGISKGIPGDKIFSEIRRELGWQS